MGCTIAGQTAGRGCGAGATNLRKGRWLAMFWSGGIGRAALSAHVLIAYPVAATVRTRLAGAATTPLLVTATPAVTLQKLILLTFPTTCARGTLTRIALFCVGSTRG